MGNLYSFVIRINKEKKDSPTTQEKDMLPQVCQTEHSIEYTFKVAPNPPELCTACVGRGRRGKINLHVRELMCIA